MSDEILDELRAIRETLENIAQMISLSVGVEPQQMNVNFRVEDVSMAMKKWKEEHRRGDLGWGLF